jgi:fatty-acyl-CoA synthase
MLESLPYGNMMYIGDYIGRRELYSPGKLAVIDTGKSPELRLTYQEMNARANRLANWLRQAGVQKGDRVAILACDGVEHLDFFFACCKLGAIHTALNWRLHPHELADICAHVEPVVLAFSADYAEKAEVIRRSIAGGEAERLPLQLIHLEGQPGFESTSYAGILAHSPAAAVTCEGLEAEDIAALIFTGGTTGLPKAVQISHRMIGWNTLNTVIHDITHHDIYVNVFPMFHTGGLFVYTLPQIIFGGTTILLRQFDPALVLELVEREKATILVGVPTMYQMITQAPNWDRADLSTLRFCTSGGAPLAVPLVEKYTQEKGVRFKQGFGMSEFGPGIFALAAEDAVRKAGSIGRPNFFVDARIVDEQGRFLGPDQPGELVLKGPSYCSGYFRDPAASAAVLDEKGYFHTGDVAQYDSEGYYYIVDRIKDMFISGGENVYPVEIEKALYQHPSVLMCAVVGTPHPKWGEAGAACVVIRPGSTATEEEILDFLSGRLARYKVPRRVHFMEALPLSAAGKILKRELRRMVLEL